MSEIRVNSIKNEAGSGAVELTHGAIIPSGASLTGAGGLNVTGVVTATSFSGPLVGDVTGTASNATTLADGANITTGTISDDRLPDLISSNVHVISGVSTFATATANSFVGALTGDVTGTATTATVADGLQGTPNITVGVVTASSLDINGNVDINGNLTVEGVLSYQDVTNVDSLGIATARVGLDVLAGGIDITAGGINVQSGVVTATSFSGPLIGNVTGDLTGNAGTATTLINAANILGGTIDDARLPATITSDISGNAATASYASIAGLSTQSTISGVATYVEYVGSWTLQADEANTYYTFTGQGFDGTEQNPDITVLRGQRYRFINNMGAHPFQIETVAGVALTGSSGISGVNPVQDGTLFWDVRMNEASELQYRCTAHPVMIGKIHVVNAGVGASTSVNTSGIITAASFSGPLTGNADTATTATNAEGLTGSPDITVSNISAGIVTATGGFISEASSTPVVITHDGAGFLTFTVAGIGSASLALA